MSLVSFTLSTIYFGTAANKTVTAFMPLPFTKGGTVIKKKKKKKPPASAGDSDLIPGWGRSTRGGNGNTLQHSCLENSMNRGAWRAIIHGVAENWT